MEGSLSSVLSGVSTRPPKAGTPGTLSGDDREDIRHADSGPICLKISAGKRYIKSGGRRGNNGTTERRLPSCPPEHEKSEPSFFLEASGEQQGQIETDWLTADWHEKPKPRKRRRRNVLPEAYRALSKSEKQQVRAAAKWIRNRVSLLELGQEDAGRRSRQARPQAGQPQGSGRPLLQGTGGLVSASSR